jgi:SNF2 family DNA or RNA helicase
VIELTSEWTKSAAARAVPGAWWNPEAGAWVLDDPTPRSAVVALKLFPHLMHTSPELVELRDSMLQDARPVDYARQLELRIGASRVRAQMKARGWSLSEAKALPLDAGPDYQEVDLGYAAACLRQHKGFYLGWSRGLGKTIGTAALIDDLDCQSTLVVAPNTAKASTWAAELEWATPWLTVLVLPNDAKQRTACLERAKYLHAERTPFVLIVHYEALAVIAGKLTSKAKGSGRTKKSLGDGWRKLKIEWDLIAADEGHRLANHQTMQARAAGRIPAKARLVLSGSVFQNKWEELYGPLHFLFPDRYKAKHRDWCQRFLDYVSNGYGDICVGILPGRVEAMRDELGRFMVVRDKQNKAIKSTELVQLTDGQQKVYDDLANQLLAELPNGERIKSSDGIALLTRLRQVATGLDLFDPGVIADSSKLERAVEVIRRHWDRGDDYVVFGWYKPSLQALAERLAAEGIDCFIIDGDVPQRTRAEIIAAFQNGQKRVLLGTISTMGESINLQRANHVIRVDRCFNPATNQQAVDRVDRQGQERECYLTDIIAEGTVDDLVVQPNLANKEALRAVVFGGQA